MKIVKAFPPNYQRIIEVIPAVKLRQGIIFTYGDTVYKPFGPPELPDHLHVHEQTHWDEQQKMGVDEWWEEYLKNPQFRLDQELMAYQNQYQVVRKDYGRENKKKILNAISKDLSGAMYGKIIDRKTASKRIMGETGF